METYQELFYQQFADIPGFETWESVELLSKGWSTDKKYIVKTKSGQMLLLRIADAESFERDPYEEFYKLESFGAELSVPYCVGQIDAYFDDDVPMQFWETLAVYVAHASLFSIKWAEKFGQKDIDGMVRRSKRTE